MSEHIIEVQQLTRRFGTLTAVNAVEFSVFRGERFAIIGPAGAGKTTLTGLLCTLLSPTAGIALVDGCQIGREDRDIRSRIGAVFTSGFLDQALTVKANLRLRGALYGLKKSALASAVHRASDITGISPLLGERYGTLPLYQRKQVELARAIIHSPVILLLDDFFTGLDPDHKEDIQKTIVRVADKTQMTVVYTARDIEDTDMADRMIVMNRGLLLAEGSAEDLVGQYSSNRLRLILRDEGAAWEKLSLLLNSEGYRFKVTEEHGRRFMDVDIANSMGALLLVNRIVHLVEGFEMTQGSLRDAYNSILHQKGRGAIKWAL